MMETIHLDGEQAEKFVKMKVGQKVSFTVEGEIHELGQYPDYEGMSDKDMRAGKEPKKMRPRVMIRVTSIDGMKTGKKAKDMSPAEVEEEVQRVKENG